MGRVRSGLGCSIQDVALFEVPDAFSAVLSVADAGWSGLRDGARGAGASVASE